MGNHSDAEAYIKALNASTRKLAKVAHELFLAAGCTSYVKTIYVGYDLQGEMVAAMYGHADRLEVALALPEDVEGALLIDATHLTWRTLPVAAVVREPAQLDDFAALVTQACERVSEGSHDVMRDNDTFIRSRRDRGPRGLGQ